MSPVFRGFLTLFASVALGVAVGVALAPLIPAIALAIAVLFAVSFAAWGAFSLTRGAVMAVRDGLAGRGKPSETPLIESGLNLTAALMIAGGIFVGGVSTAFGEGALRTALGLTGGAALLVGIGLETYRSLFARR
jgi:hypothetical protein